MGNRFFEKPTGDPRLAKKLTDQDLLREVMNTVGKPGRWAFAMFSEVYRIEADFEAKLEVAFNNVIENAGRSKEQQ